MIPILNRDEVAKLLEMERSARGESEPITTRIEDERDIERLRQMIADAERDIAISQRHLKTLKDSLGGEKQVSGDPSTAS